ncbi:H-NS family nucleoid-associated regulatory protein [Cupriavidus necator]|uniref:H-NS family nucleoid-associated regulatory protein n=1 Tax=Cupriavidus necator TaxID=106590 RepID=UPI003ECD6574
MTGNNERAEAIRWIQDQGCFDPPPPPPPPAPVCYRNAEGLTWDGQGEMPSWLKRAVNAGKCVEFYWVG